MPNRSSRGSVGRAHRNNQGPAPSGPVRLKPNPKTKTLRNRVLGTLARLAPAQRFAIPAWSRGEATACSSCRAIPTWRQTRVGLDFLKKGHRNDATKMNVKAQTWDNYLSLISRGRLVNDQLDGARSPIEVSSKDTCLGGPILSAGTTKFSDKELFAQVTWGFCAGWFIVSRSVGWAVRLVPRRFF